VIPGIARPCGIEEANHAFGSCHGDITVSHNYFLSSACIPRIEKITRFKFYKKKKTYYIIKK
jgi:hypothetical protein